MLTFIFAHADGNAGRYVFEPDGAAYLVDVLPAWPACSADMFDNVARINLYIYFLWFRQYRDGGGGGVDSALRFGFRHSLDAMTASFES